MDLYYYTTVETMRYILQGSNIYATNLGYMNDSQEYANGVRELRNILNEKMGNELITDQVLQEELEKEIIGYSISFSEARDLLSQWTMYAGESGVSIRMCFTGAEKFKAYPATNEEEREYIVDAKQGLTTQKVYYCTKEVMNQEEYDQAVNEIWMAVTKGKDKVTQADIEGNYTEFWRRMAPYVKRVEFKAEAEHRLVFNANEWKQVLKIDYRNSRGVLKPYLDVECENGWPIHEIVIGPGFNQEAVFNSVLHFLNNTELKIPQLSAEQYLQRCQEYFDGCEEKQKSITDKIQKVLDENKDDFKGDTNDFYNLFIYIRNKILSLVDLDNDYREQLMKRMLTKNGIILSRSRIPYIYGN